MKKSGQLMVSDKKAGCCQTTRVILTAICTLAVVALAALLTWKITADQTSNNQPGESASHEYIVSVNFDTTLWSRYLEESPKHSDREHAKLLVNEIDDLLHKSALCNAYVKTVITKIWEYGFNMTVVFREPQLSGLDSFVVKETLTEALIQLSELNRIKGNWTIRIYGADNAAQVLKTRVERQADQDCGQHKRLCNDGACVYNSWWCNKDTECLDGSDEWNCDQGGEYSLTSPPTYTPITANIPQGNGQSDGFDTTTEHMYTLTSEPTASKSVQSASSTDFTCRAGTFQCDNGACVPLDWVCDKVMDCTDGSDETEEGCQRARATSSLFSNITEIRMITTSPDAFGGRIEVEYKGELGTICDDYWGEQEAVVACKTFYPGYKAFPRHRAWYGQGRGPIWLDGVECTGLEESLTQCGGKPLGQVDCQHSEDAGVLCSPQIEKIRLVDGDETFQGRVELLVNGHWGIICDSGGWNRYAAQVVCRMLNISGPAFSLPSKQFGGRTLTKVFIERLNCTGKEETLFDCPVEDGVMGPVGDIRGLCTSSQAAGVSCGEAVCQSTEIKCEDKLTCILLSQRCDGEIDCPDRSDEMNCPSSCEADEFTCINSRDCVNGTEVCDGEFDCGDGSDEIGCVDKREDGAAVVLLNVTWTPICYDIDMETAIGESYCRAIGMRGLYQVISMTEQEMGIRLFNGSGTSPIQGFEYSSEELCIPFKVECFNDDCGLRGPRPAVPFVRNGQPALAAEWRWQVRLIKFGDFSCGGSILTPRFILTANHCVRSVLPSSVIIVVGDIDRRNFEETEVSHSVKAIYHHPDYRFESRHSFNDVAVLELNEPIDINRYAGPICLPDEDIILSDHCYITGWGRDELDFNVFRLQEAKVTVYNHTRCNAEFPSLSSPVPPATVCATHRTRYSPAGNGDSGGPLVCRSSSGRWYQLGIAGYNPNGRLVSFGENLSVFHSVVYHKKWIREQLFKSCSLVCDGGTKCIESHLSLCDGKADCLDKSDESRYCGIDCDFEKNITCGLSLHGNWKLHNASLSRSYTFHQGMNLIHTYQTGSQVSNVSSPILNITSGSCLRFSVHGPNMSVPASSLTIVSVGRDGHTETAMFPSVRSTIWTTFQVNVSVRISRIIFSSNVRPGGYLALDDVQMLSGDCPDLDCPNSSWKCENGGRCVQLENVCDKAVQCADASDEQQNCSQYESVNCEFDHQYKCGYHQNGILQNWERIKATRTLPDHTYKDRLSDYDCDFEQGLCNWRHDTSGDIDWMRKQGPTPSLDTGPSFDHTLGNSSGWYVYIESSLSIFGERARLISQSITDGQTRCLSFWYHMHGSDVNRLTVYQKSSSGLETSIWSLFGPRGFTWNSASVTIHSKDRYQVIFEAVDGNGFEGDIALDDITLSLGACLTGVNDCDFEQGLCGWSQDTSDGFDWNRRQGLTLTSGTGPTFDHTLGNSSGSYVYIDSSTSPSFSRARLISQPIRDAQTMCLTFWYHMHGGDIDRLAVFLNTSAGLGTDVWSRTFSQGNLWLKGTLNLNLTVPYQVVFQAATLIGSRGDTALDDITISRGPCNASSGVDQPEVAEQQKDFYLKYQYDGGTAIAPSLKSPMFEIAQDSCYEFFYRMASYDNLTISLRQVAEDGSSRSQNFVWSKVGLGNKWRLGQIHLVPGRYEVLFDVSLIKSSSNSPPQVHIDDVQVRPGPCDESVQWCDRSEFACSDGSCIDMDQSCDNVTNCPDGSDVLLDGTPAVSQAEANRTIRLVDGTATEGRVEILVDGLWGTLCNDTFSSREATVVCGMLGLSDPVIKAPDIPALENENVYQLSCSGLQTSIEECEIFQQLNASQCVWGDVVLGCLSAVCSPTGDNLSSDSELYPGQRVRLRDGASELEGRVEILYNNTWGTICNDGWTEAEALAVCRTLGYLGSGTVVKNISRGTGPIWLDEVTCGNSDLNIFECSTSGVNVHDCTHYDDVGVQCNSSSCQLDQILCDDQKTCIEPQYICDGEVDCIDGGDELQCVTNCRNDDFVCDKRSRCLSQQSVCDGTMDCADGTDEAKCVRLREDGVPLVVSGSQSYPICFHEAMKVKIADSLCKAMGEWGAYDALPGNTTEIGLSVTMTNSSSVLQGFALSVTRACTPLVELCVKKECGRSKSENLVRDVSEEWTGHVTILSRNLTLLCNGTLFNHRFVLTSSSCLGALGGPDHVLVNNSRILINSSVTLSENSSLAVITLLGPVPDPRPACLPELGTVLTNRCYLTSYYRKPEYGTTVLRRVKVDVYNSTVCESKFLGEIAVNESNICVSLGTSRSPVCDGSTDYSGSSLLCEDAAGFWTIVGIYNSQPFGCAREDGLENVAVFSSVEYVLTNSTDNSDCEFSCDNGRCLSSISQVCDGTVHCLDRADELRLCGVNCDFELEPICGYKPVEGPQAWNWSTGIFSDHTLKTRNGHFLLHTNSDINTRISSATESPVFTVSSESCLEFYYYMPTQSTTLDVQLINVDDDPNSKDTVWSLSNKQGSRWRLGQIELTNGTYKVVFAASSFSPFGNLLQVGLDDISVRDGECLTSVISCAVDEFECDKGNCIMLRDSCNKVDVSCPGNFTNSNCSDTPASAPERYKLHFGCDFEGGFCTWTQDVTDDFNWRRLQGPTSSDDTGPRSDHTTGTSLGWYAYIETSSPRDLGDRARLISPAIDDRRTKCLSFWYHMYGSSINRLNVYLSTSAGLGSSVWSRYLSQGNVWLRGTVIINLTESYQIVFEGISGSSYEGDIALDDIAVYDNECPPDFPAAPVPPVSGGAEVSRIRLAGSVDPSQGRVEIFHDSRWGTICDDNFDSREAGVICRMLGYSYGEFKRLGEGSGTIWLDQLGCDGTESDIGNCPHIGWGNEDCSHFEDAGVKCYITSLRLDERIRLVQGSLSGEGRVEVLHQGIWGTICDNLFGDNEALVICRMLGYRSAQYFNFARFGSGSGTIWLTDLGCQGNETSIMDCPHRGWGVTSSCAHFEDAGVRCSDFIGLPERPQSYGLKPSVSRDPSVPLLNSVRLRGGSSLKVGRLEVLLDSQWGTICNDSWNEMAADIACRTLGFVSGKTISLQDIPPGTGPIWMDEVQCDTFATDIFNCSSSPYGIHDCTHYQDVAVSCNDCVDGALPCDGNSKCFTNSSACDGIMDCLDGRDEDNCADLTGMPSIFGDTPRLGKLRGDKAALISISNEWYPLCYEESVKLQLAQSFCSAFGKSGVVSTRSSSTKQVGVDVYDRGQSDGLRVHISDKPCHYLHVGCKEDGCGVKGPNQVTRFVEGGMESTSGEWPWYATVEDEQGTTICSAVVISLTWIATTHRCVLPSLKDSVHIVVGRDYQNQGNSTEQKIGLKRLFYSSSGGTFINVLLIELQSPIAPTEAVRPVCLPSDTTVFTPQCYTLGEGPFGQNGARILRKAPVVVYNTRSCRSEFPTSLSISERVRHCVVRRDGLPQTCELGTAEPVTCKADTGEWTLHSISTYDQTFSCSRSPYLPLTLSLPIQSILPWITRTMSCLKCGETCISESSLCDGRIDCADNSDETVHCGGPSNCTFDFKSTCGYNISRSIFNPGWYVTERNGRSKDYIVGVLGGVFGQRKVIVSENITTTTTSCLRLWFSLIEGVFELNLWNETSPSSQVTRISHQMVSSNWTRLRVELPIGTTRIQFTAYHNTTVSMDNITVVGEQCPISHCDEMEFECNPFVCVPLSQECDGKIDCPQGEDEGSRCLSCDPVTEFQCHNGFCVNQSLVCDDKQDCSDGSDEFNCSCTGFSCDRGRTCISNSLFCDGVVDCDDLKDETNCGTCQSFQRRCGNNYCRPSRYWCDGEDDCLDGSDESNCTCTNEEWRCTDGRCIVSSWKCDGYQDCVDGSDERNCSSCVTGQRVCTDHTCVPQTAWCNGTVECPDSSDESNCFSLQTGTSRSGLLKVLTHTNTSLPVCAVNWNDEASATVCQTLGQYDASTTDYLRVSYPNFLVFNNKTNGAAGLRAAFQRDVCPSQMAVHVTCKNEECGKRSAGKRPYQPFIVGGEVSSAGSWPWVALLYYQKTARCGATIIDDQWLVTAAHCVKEKRLPFYFEILAGTVNTAQLGDTVQRRSVDRIYVHPTFSRSRSTLPGDIALLHLSAPLNRTAYVKPICLPQSDTRFPLSTTCFSAGFGSVLRGVKVLVSTMREGKLRLWSSQRCSQAYNNRISTEDKLCAGYASGIITPCFGDSGGPLMCQVTKGRWTFSGVISVGESNCGKGSSFSGVKPTAFSQITTYIDWIRQTAGLTAI